MIVPAHTGLRPSYRGRLAPSPTGALHLGGASTFLIAWLEARVAKGALVLRMEDLDAPRVRAGGVEQLVDDMRWLGLDWNEGPDVGGPFRPYEQSARGAQYEAALATLAARGHTYFCDCSRAEIVRLASAPHEPSDEGPRYPGTCRHYGMSIRAFRRPPAVRFRAPEGRIVELEDLVLGHVQQDVAAEVGDFVLRRGDGVFAYQLAVVVDDLVMDITHVVRGADLLRSAPRQLLVREALGGSCDLSFAHAPLILGARSERLAKRADGVSVRDHRNAGRAPSELLGSLAYALGIADDDRPRSAPEILVSYDRARLSRVPVRAPTRLVGAT